MKQVLRIGVVAVMVVAAASVSPVDPAGAAVYADWSKQSPLPTGQFLHGVDMVSTTQAWAVGELGAIIHSTNGGAGWNKQASGVTVPLFGVRFADALHGWAVGNALLYTSDGGATWKQGTGAPGTFYGVDGIDANMAWAVGGGGWAIKTTDGGTTWSGGPTPSTSNLKDVDFVDSASGWAVGGSGAIIHTGSGGSTWTKQISGTTAFLDGVSFVSAQEGWAAGENVLLHTTNGGATWVKQSVPSAMWTYSLAFADSLNGWSVGANQGILRTSDGGVTWKTQLGGTYGAKNRFPFEGVDVADPSHGIAVGACGTLYTTSDGTKWTPRLSGSCTTTDALEATDANDVWAANDEGEILLTTNGGRTWSRVELSVALLSGAYLGDVEFVDNLKGWTVSSGGTIGDQFVFATTNGGKSWIQTGPHDNANLYSIDTLDGQSIVAVGYACCVGPRIVRSADGGTTWAVLPNPPGVSGDQFYDVEYSTSTTAWIVGDTQDLLKSTDGGATWTQQGLFGPDTYFDISWADSLNGWIDAIDGTTLAPYLLHTTDGGATWVRQETGIAGAGGAVLAVSPTEAWVGGTGVVAHTTDGGATWTAETPSANGTFQSLVVVGTSVWAGGSDDAEVTGGIWKRP